MKERVDDSAGAEGCPSVSFIDLSIFHKKLCAASGSTFLPPSRVAGSGTMIRLRKGTKEMNEAVHMPHVGLALEE